MSEMDWIWWRGWALPGLFVVLVLEGGWWMYISFVVRRGSWVWVAERGVEVICGRPGG